MTSFTGTATRKIIIFCHFHDFPLYLAPKSGILASINFALSHQKYILVPKNVFNRPKTCFLSFLAYRRNFLTFFIFCNISCRRATGVLKFSFLKFFPKFYLKNLKFYIKKIHAGLEIHSMNQILDILTFVFLIFRREKPIGQLFITFLDYFHRFLARYDQFYWHCNPKNHHFLPFS